MKVLVTGASGLIGRHTVRTLTDEGHDVQTLHRGPAVSDVRHWAGDVLNPDSVREASRGCDAVVHLAGRGDVGESRRDPIAYAHLNSIGTLNALEAARTVGASFVLASSQRVYPLRPELCREDDALSPDSPYGYAKWTAELWCRMESEQFQVPTTVLRFFSVYGPGQQANGLSGVVSIFAKAALAGEPLVARSGGQRDFTDASDVALGIAKAVKRKQGEFRVYNVATGVGTSFRAMADQVVELTGSSSTVSDEPTEPAGTDLVADISRAREELGYEPSVDLKAGLTRYIDWLRENRG